MENREKIAESINAHSVNVILRKALMKDDMFCEDFVKSIEKIVGREQAMEETKMITINKYMYDSIQMQNEQLQAIIRMAKAGTLTPDHVLIITGENQEEE